MKICNKCIYDENVPNIVFNDDGICNYCEQIVTLEKKYQTGNKQGIKSLDVIIKKIKKNYKHKKYDCVIGVSGGTDSSYMMLKAIEWGLRPLAVHYDNTWNTSIATENIRKVTSKLNIDLHTYVIDNKESDDIFRSFFIAGVPEFDASTDLALAQVLRMVAAKYKIKYILEGHSFKAEGVSPQGNNYFDGKYIKDIHGKFGKIKMKTYPLMSLYQFLKWTIIYRQKFIRPFWYIEYSKPNAREELIKKTGWEYYGGHHLENRATAFAHKIYLPKKFNIDHRNWSLSAEVRSGILERNKALKIYNKPIKDDPELVEYAKKRMSLNDDEYDEVFNGINYTYKDYKTYKKTFEYLRFLFFILSKFNLVPLSFYLKYCFPDKAKS